MGSDADGLYETEVEPLLRLLKSSSTTNKVNSINKLNSILKLKNNELADTQLNLICLSILKTYLNNPLNSKFDSLVLQSFAIFLSINPEKYFKVFAKFVHDLSSKPLASTDVLVLLEWNSFLIAQSAKNDKFESLAKELVSSSVSLVDNIATVEQQDIEDPTKWKRHRQRILHSAQRLARSGIVSALQKNATNLKLFVKYICDAKLPVSGVLAHIGLLASAVTLANTKKIGLIDAFTTSEISTIVISSHFVLLMMI
ncbi:unnamed protein product [Ambrosiozyma monospora]|uniref:Unnamed protein product n=1 Tax=Ambrosiozyma monospora TaxID=43982 RepID=A0ACB5T9B3_AMBMO|nr:unnamed protein product [Ambrosiozyma monospora]